jgi:hypothetical protein
MRTLSALNGPSAVEAGHSSITHDAASGEAKRTEKMQGGEYCYVIPMAVHTVTGSGEAVPLLIVNSFEVPVYDVRLKIKQRSNSLKERGTPAGRGLHQGEDVETLDPGTVPPNLSALSWKVRTGTYIIDIITSRGRFSENLVLTEQEGELKSDFTLTDLRDARVIIPAKSLLRTR